MSTSRTQSILEDYQFHNMLILRFVDGISHEESTLQLPFHHNCMNWILGHIVNNRSHVLETVNVSHAWQEDIRRLYQTGTQPITQDSESLAFNSLIKHLQESAALLGSALSKMDDKELDEFHTNYRGEKNRYEQLTGFHWHETFHIGQLEILRAFIESKRKK